MGRSSNIRGPFIAGKDLHRPRLLKTISTKKKDMNSCCHLLFNNYFESLNRHFFHHSITNRRYCSIVEADRH